MIDQCDPLFEKLSHYQVHCDREYDRVFSNHKIQKDTGEKIDFVKVRDGLKQFLKEFLVGKRQFTYRSWCAEAVFDKISNERASFFKIPTLKNKLKYFLFRYII